MKPAWLSVLLLALFSCNDPSGNQSQPAAKADRTWQQNKVWAVDSGLFDASFLRELAKSDYPDSIFLFDQYLITGTDTLYYPNYPQPGSAIRFSAQGYSLEMSRASLASIDYRVTWQDDHNNMQEQKGHASLPPLFFLAAEVLEDSENHETSGFTVFLDSSASYPISIYAGLDTNRQGKLLAAFAIDLHKPPRQERLLSPVMVSINDSL